MLTLAQKVYLVQCYGTGDVSARFAIEKFNIKYPNVHVHRTTLLRVVKKFEATGNIHIKKKEKKKYDDDDAGTILALQSVRENPRMSLRKRSNQLGLSISFLSRVYAINKIRPYQPRIRHTLEAGDDAKRLDFCLWMGDKISEDRYFYRKIIFSDESTFSTNGIVSSQNSRYWNEVNPNVTINTNRQYLKKTNVWCAVLPDSVIGPYFFDTNVNQNSYLDMLNNFFLETFDDIPLRYASQLFFQQDGCPAHSTNAVTNWMNREFGEKWIGRRSRFQWPARSPDLSIIDFFIWGYLKERVYSVPMPNDVNILKNRIREEINNITPQMLNNAYDAFRTRLELCVNVGGDIFE